MSARAPETLELDVPELHDRTLLTGAQLLASGTAFFFLAFLFAYTYLRSLDNGAAFRPRGVDAPEAVAAISTALVVLSALLSLRALVVQRAGRHGAVVAPLAGALLCGLAALATQALEWATIDFGPNSGGYASVFVGWTGFYALFLAATLVWLEIQLATALRNRGRVLSGLRAFCLYLVFLAGVAVVTFVVLDLITP